MKRIILAIGLIFILAGCGAQVEEKDEAQVLEGKTLIIGLDTTFAPYGYENEQGELVGFDIDISKEIEKRLGVQFEYQSIDWAMKETELFSKKIDLIWNGYSITQERIDKGVLFTNPYKEGAMNVLVNKDSEIQKIADLEGKRVSLQSASTAESEVLNYETGISKKFEGGGPISYPTYNEVLSDLKNGRADAVVADKNQIERMLQLMGMENDVRFLEENFGEEKTGIGFRAEDEWIVSEFNRVLEELKEEGFIQELMEKWFNDGTNN